MIHHEGHEEHEVWNSLLSEPFVSFVTFVVQTSVLLHAEISLITTIARITRPSVIPVKTGIQVSSTQHQNKPGFRHAPE
ncbi:MAG: hypothetical protein HW419_4052 [Deltaproteobacteria bacterium]|nr:hypothetical protein [Deltaproteobacteria bacterium]